MAVVWQSSGKWWTIEEYKLGLPLGQLQACLERVDLAPELDNLFLFLGEVEGLRYCGALLKRCITEIAGHTIVFRKQHGNDLPSAAGDGGYCPIFISPFLRLNLT